MLTLKRVIYLLLIFYLLNITLIFFGTIKFSYEAKRIISDKSNTNIIYSELILNDIRNSINVNENLDKDQYNELLTNITKILVDIKQSINDKGTIKFVIDNYDVFKIYNIYFNKIKFMMPNGSNTLNIEFNFSYELMFWRIESIYIN